MDIGYRVHVLTRDIDLPFDFCAGDPKAETRQGAEAGSARSTEARKPFQQE